MMKWCEDHANGMMAVGFSLLVFLVACLITAGIVAIVSRLLMGC